MKFFYLRVLGVILFLLLGLSRGYAGDIVVRLTIDKTSASLDDTLLLQVTVEGVQSAPEPVLKNTDDFEIRSSGTTSQIQILNGHYSTSKVFQYGLSPRRLGHFTLGPAQVTLDGKTYESETATVDIISEGQGTAAPIPRDRNTYIRAEVSTSNPFVGQQIIYTFRFYSQVPVQNAHLQTPEFEGFWKESLGDTKNYQQVINGQTWQVSELKWALFPMAVGEKTIGSMYLTADVAIPSRHRNSIFDDPFFNNALPHLNIPSIFQSTEKRDFHTDPMSIEVRPLPEEGRPIDFRGLVGDFKVNAVTSAPSAEVGESITLTLTLEGHGNLRDAPAAELQPSDRENFKIYDDQPTLQTTPSPQGVYETKTFKKALVALKPGSLTLPALTLSYFNPQKKVYVSTSTNPIVLNIRPSSHPEKEVIAGIPTNQKPTFQAPGSPLILKEQAVGLSQHFYGMIKKNRIKVGTVFLILIFIMALIRWWMGYRKKIRSDAGYLRRKRADKMFTKGMKLLEKTQGKDFYEQASHLLREFIGNKTNTDAGSLTAADIERRVAPLGISEENCKKMKTILETCDAGLYGGEFLTPEKRDNLVDELRRFFPL